MAAEALGDQGLRGPPAKYLGPCVVRQRGATYPREDVNMRIFTVVAAAVGLLFGVAAANAREAPEWTAQVQDEGGPPAWVEAVKTDGGPPAWVETRAGTPDEKSETKKNTEADQAAETANDVGAAKAENANVPEWVAGVKANGGPPTWVESVKTNGGPPAWVAAVRTTPVTPAAQNKPGR